MNEFKQEARYPTFVRYCRCRHTREAHYHGLGICEAPTRGYANPCSCRRYRRATRPTTPTPEGP